jgi:signal-transduction protein with cAMP-binding, CBS, and nucleotidyltransferase domain
MYSIMTIIKDILQEPVSKYTVKKLVAVDGNITVSNAAQHMVESNIDSFLVSENDDITGIVTNRDIMTDVVAKGIDPTQISVKEIAHKPLIKIQKDATVQNAISLMSKHNIRRLLVEDSIRPIGTITQSMIIGNLSKDAIPLPMLESPSSMICPYCLSPFDDKLDLSKHIDNIHIGKGLLEGNISKDRM